MSAKTPDYRAVTFGIEALTATTPYVLVDLSDTTNFPHVSTTGLHLLGLILSTEKAGDGQHDVWVGVVTENDATNGSATWVHCFHIEKVNNPTDSTDQRFMTADFGAGIDLTVISGALAGFASNLTQAGNVNWQNDTNRVSPVGSTTKPGVGDLVLWVEEVGGTGTIDFCLTVLYKSV